MLLARCSPSLLLQGIDSLPTTGTEGGAALQHHSKYSPGIIAIAGYDPAVLAIWNLQVCRVPRTWKAIILCTS